MSGPVDPTRSSRPETGPGWAVVDAARSAVERAFGRRVRSWYVIGSLAHGGFAPLVSDVDVALVLDEVALGDQGLVDELVASVKELDLALGSRLSLFWGSAASIAGAVPGGRFPPLDRLDLIESGVLVGGDEIRSHLPPPTVDELIVGAAEFVVGVFALPARRSEITDPATTVVGGPRPSSKVALFPVRFLHTLRTGEIGTNEAAIEGYLAIAEAGPRRALVEAAAQWRHRWSDADAGAAVGLLTAGAVALYDEFVGEYAERLRALGRDELAVALEAWRASLDGD